MTDKINAEETDGKRVGKKIQRKKKVQVSNVELNEQSQDTQQGESFGFDGFRSS